MELDFGRDFTEEEVNYISTLSDAEIEKLEQDCADYIMLCDTNQINRKLLINSLYGASLQVIGLYTILFLMIAI